MDSDLNFDSWLEVFDSIEDNFNKIPESCGPILANTLTPQNNLWFFNSAGDSVPITKSTIYGTEYLTVFDIPLMYDNNPEASAPFFRAWKSGGKLYVQHGIVATGDGKTQKAVSPEQRLLLTRQNCTKVKKLEKRLVMDHLTGELESLFTGQKRKPGQFGKKKNSSINALKKMLKYINKHATT